jgi:hypothetical protein
LYVVVQVRLKVKDWFSVRLLPRQVLKINKRWQLGASPVALRVNYECPLDNLANPLAAPSRLMVRWAALHTGCRTAASACTFSPTLVDVFACSTDCAQQGGGSVTAEGWI